VARAATDSIRALLRAEAPAQRRAALEAVTLFASDWSDPEAVGRLLDDPDEEVRCAALRAAGELGEEACGGVLLKRVLAASASPHLPEREAAVESLCSVGPPAIRALCAVLADTRSPLALRTEALFSLASCIDRDDVLSGQVLETLGLALAASDLGEADPNPA